MKIMPVINKKNKYRGSGWDTEICHRYVFCCDDEALIEASYFEHYNNTEFVKYVVELPLTVGCTMGCRFCAASSIGHYRPLEQEEISQIYESIVTEENLGSHHLITFTGTGEMNNNLENLRGFIENLESRKPRLAEYTFSTMNLSRNIAGFINEHKNSIAIRRIQVSFVSCNEKKIEGLIPYFATHEYSIDKTVGLIKQMNERFIRINYILIKEFNNTDEDYENFISYFSPVKRNIRVRISKLNETMTSKKNHLEEPPMADMEYFDSLLKRNGFDSYIYCSFVNDNMNCGQLVSESGIGVYKSKGLTNK